MIKYKTFYAPQETMQNGIFGEHYTGYHNNDPLFFENTKPVVARIDSQVNTTYELAASSNGDNFSIRWSLLFYADTAGVYSFTVNSDDESYLFVGKAATQSAPPLSSGQYVNQSPRSIVVTLKVGYHPILIYYGNGGGGRYISFDYTPPGGGYQTIPSNKLFLPPSAYSKGLKADYYPGCYNSSQSFFDTNQPAYSRIDSKIEFSNTFPLLPSVSSGDSFSVRWSGFLKIDVAGTYTFTTYSDDIAHFFIGDSALVLNPTPDLATGTYSNNGNGQIVATLNSGYIPILLYFGEIAGAEIMNLSYSGPGISQMIIPADKLYRRAYKHPVTNYTTPPVTDSLVVDLDPLYGVEYVPGTLGMVSWKNKVNDKKLIMDANAVFVPNDPAFSNLPTVKNVTGNGFQPYVLDDTPNAFTLIMVNQRTPGPDSMLWSNGPDGSGMDLFSASGRIGLNGWGGEAYGPIPEDLSKANIFTTTISDVVSTTGSFRIYSNGKYNDPSTYMGASPGNRSIDKSFRFGGAASNGYIWYGSFARILLYNRILDGDELNKVHNYLSTTYKQKMDNEITSDPYFKLTLDNNQGGQAQIGRWATTSGWEFQNGLAVAGNGAYLWEDLIVIAGAEYEVEVIIDEFISGTLIINSTSTSNIPLYTSGIHRYRYTQNGSVQRMHLYGAYNFCGVVSKFSVTQIGNPPPVIDSDVTNFTTAANIIDETQKLAVKNLVKALKLANLWGKMKCIYPFVGGNEQAHILNLKDPRYFDIAFRLYFPNGARHDEKGVHFNGNNQQYARTYYIPSQHTAQGTGGTIVYYVQKPNTHGDDPVDIGSYNNANDLFFIRTTVSNYTYGGVSNNYVGSPIKFNGGYISAAGGDGKAYTYFNRNVQGENNTSNASTNVGLEQFIGCINLNGPYGFTTANARFAAFGEKLTIAENKLFCDAVEAYQLTLGRAVLQKPEALYTAASLPTNISPVNMWTNTGTLGTRYNLIPYSTEPPAYYGTGGPGGKPFVRFASQTTALFSSDNFFLSGSMDITIIMVVRCPNISRGYFGFAANGGVGGSFNFSNTYGRYTLGMSNQDMYPNGYIPDVWQIVTIRTTGSRVDFKVNNQPVQSETYPSLNTNANRLLLGTSYDGIVANINLDIAEFQVYTNYMGDDDLLNKLNILNAYYALGI